MNHITTFLCILILFASCNKEEMPEEMTPVETDPEVMTEDFNFQFNTDIHFSTYTNFVVLSDSLGAPLFDTVGTGLDFEVNFEIESNTIVNATIGYVADKDNFSIVSYKDIKSGSQLDLSNDWEMHPCFQSRPVDGSQATLTVTDLDDFHETINPMESLNHDAIELIDNTITLKGRLSSVNDINYQFAIREQEGSELKSIVIPKSDWTWDNETQSMHHTVSFGDFSSTFEHVINLTKTEKWGIEATACDQLGSPISLQYRYGFFTTDLPFDQQIEDVLTIYLNDEVEINELKIHLTSRLNDGYHYNWIHQDIPENITVRSNPNVAFPELDNRKFTLLSTFEYNFNALSYLYSGTNLWTIITEGGMNISFTKPNLPVALYELHPELESVLQSSTEISNTMFYLKDVNDITKIHKFVIPSNSNNWPDLNYSSVTRKVSF